MSARLPPSKVPSIADADWSALPGTALEIISVKLAAHSPAAYVHFCSVCTSWRAGAVPRRPHLPSVVGISRSPGYVYSNDGGFRIHSSFAFSGEGLCPLAELLPEPVVVPSGVLCFGSSHGWLTLFEPDSLRVSLWKPFNGDRIWLPPLSHSVAKIPDKLILSSSDPAIDSGCLVLLSHRNQRGSGRKLSYCRPGYQRWTPIKKGLGAPLVDFFDAAFHNGRFYLVCCRQFYVLHLGPPAKLERLRLPRALSSRFDPEESYLLHSRGKLLLVSLDDPVERVPPAVYALYFVGEKLKWLQMTDLGDRAAFIGKNNSFAISAQDFPGCRRNCIYMAYDREKFIRVFNLEKFTNQIIYPPAAELASNWTPYAWLPPMLL